MAPPTADAICPGAHLIRARTNTDGLGMAAEGLGNKEDPVVSRTCHSDDMAPIDARDRGST